MLLEFEATNYKSFKDKMTLSMKPAPKIKDLSYSVQTPKRGVSVLSTAVIYGPNASGKTNIIGAIDTFKGIILRGDIKNEKPQSLNVANGVMELIPNIHEDESTPVEFSMKFIDGGTIFRFSLSIKLGSFLDKTFQRKVCKEKLEINEKLIYVRTDKSVEVNNENINRQYLNKGFSKTFADNISEISNIDARELFLTTIFKSVYSNKLVSAITDWLENRFELIYQSNKTLLLPLSLKADEEKPKTNEEKLEREKIYVNSKLTEAASLFGANSQNIGYSMRENETPYLVSLVDYKGIPMQFPSSIFESFGTNQFFSVFSLVYEAIIAGNTIIIDEFDASIHPAAIMNIVKLFHDNEINKKGAQLIFNTHNPIYLNADLLRRDEIVFTEYDNETQSSKIYRLSDFGTSGSDGVRKGEDYMKHYFIGEYGAIKDIDFSPLFEERITEKNDRSFEED